MLKFLALFFFATALIFAQTPSPTNFGGQAGTLLSNGKLQLVVLTKGGSIEWLAALSSSRHSIFGYIFRREDYPWLQTWDNYPNVAGLVHGLEFGTQPYDLGRRIITDNGPLFNTPVWRWLPAKSTIESHFLVFYARVPEGVSKVDSIELQNGQIVIEDRAAQKKISLAASRGLN